MSKQSDCTTRCPQSHAEYLKDWTGSDPNTQHWWSSFQSRNSIVLFKFTGLRGAPNHHRRIPLAQAQPVPSIAPTWRGHWTRKTKLRAVELQLIRAPHINMALGYTSRTADRRMFALWHLRNEAQSWEKASSCSQMSTASHRGCLLRGPAPTHTHTQRAAHAIVSPFRRHVRRDLISAKTIKPHIPVTHSAAPAFPSTISSPSLTNLLMINVLDPESDRMIYATDAVICFMHGKS